MRSTRSAGEATVAIINLDVETWRDSHDRAMHEACAAHRAAERKRQREALAHFVEEQNRRDRRRAWLLAPVRVLVDIVQIVRGKR